MKCAICRHGITAEGDTTVVLERGQTTVVFKKVPAQICQTPHVAAMGLVPARLRQLANRARL